MVSLDPYFDFNNSEVLHYITDNYQTLCRLPLFVWHGCLNNGEQLWSIMSKDNQTCTPENFFQNMTDLYFIGCEILFKWSDGSLQPLEKLGCTLVHDGLPAWLLPAVKVRNNFHFYLIISNRSHSEYAWKCAKQADEIIEDNNLVSIEDNNLAPHDDFWKEYGSMILCAMILVLSVVVAVSYFCGRNRCDRVNDQSNNNQETIELVNPCAPRV